MATVLFSVAGAAVGGAVGGSVAGLTSAVVGRAIGATLGRSIDQRLLGQGGQAIETGKVDRFRITSAGEGDPIARVYGRMRMGGHVIWASDFQESRTTTGGGKGGGSTPETTEFSYSVSLAIAICEGEIVRVARVWADGEEVAPDDLNMTFYPGSADQPPDPTMEAIEGVGRVPAYRGTAYVVMENLELAQFGNRVPQFSFEVLRPEQPGAPGWEHTPTYGIEGVALIPGTGEYALATTPATFAVSNGVFHNANVSSPAGKTDFAAATEAITQELPNLKSASLVVSWFGDDLRCGDCTIRPKVEDLERDAKGLPWTGSGMPREFAQVIVQEDERPLYGGTPSDASVVQAIRELNEADVAVMFYPFILMDQYTDNGLPDPYSAEPNQPNLPWRGRITLAEAPGRPGSPDGTSVANSQVNAFFGSATASSFTIFEGQVRYNPDWGNPNGAEPSGFEDVPANWSFSRFILHNAWLCAVAGGVDAFCIGSEMRGLTQIRGAGGAFVAVQRLRALAAEVRSILGPDTKISYAADWSEYFGYHPEDGSGDHYFHLDPLWADENIDFIGIDNYMPLADWRDEDGHLDGQTWDSVYNLDYLKANAAGGEGFDWYYASDADRDAQNRTPITDGLFGEDWVYRYKDIRSWWENPHHDRVGPNRIAEPTAWVPRSKPIWFTEYGCAAVNKGANQPNKFLDFKSSESSLPYHSTGARDELMQAQYLQATIAYWSDPAHNPTSAAYGAPMVDMSRAFVWAYDTRPYPFFPNNLEKWSDGENYNRGHWINGRTAGRTLASVVHEICEDAGLKDFSTDGLYGYVRGYAVEQVGDARAALQPLMIQHGFDAVERDGILQFRNRAAQRPQALDPALFAESRELDGRLEQTREAEAEVSGRMRLRFVQADADYDVIAEEATLPDEATHGVSGSEINVCLTRGEGRQTVERWLTEARVARDTVRFALPPSQLCIGAGDVIELPGDQSERAATYRIDRVEISDMQLVEGVRVDQGVYETGVIQESTPPSRPFVAPVPVLSHFLDLPLLRGDETAHAPHVAATAEPWPGSAAIYQSSADQNYALNSVVTQRSIIGMTKSLLTPARAGVF
ncbi:MAG: glycoside hydrolase/phage tail family protein, partial [Pseudomonadota bacterium]